MLKIIPTGRYIYDPPVVRRRAAQLTEIAPASTDDQEAGMDKIDEILASYRSGDETRRLHMWLMYRDLRDAFREIDKIEDSAYLKGVGIYRQRQQKIRANRHKEKT